MKVIKSKLSYKDQYISLRKDTIVNPSGQTKHHSVIVYHPSVAVVAYNQKGEILLIKNYRYPVGAHLWEIPGGNKKPNESYIESVKRELHEESGYVVKTVKLLTKIHVDPSMSRHTIHIFEAFDITKNFLKKEVEVSSIQFFSQKHIESMLLSQKILDAWSCVGLLLALKKHSLRK